MLRNLLASIRGRPGGETRRPPRAAASGPSVIGFVTMVQARRRIAPDDVGTAALASTRLRLLIPAIELARRHATTVEVIPLDALRDVSALEGEPRLTALVLGKLSTDFVRANESLLRSVLDTLAAAGRRQQVVADLSDDYSALAKESDSSFLKTYQATLLKRFDLIVSCEALRARLAPRARGAVTVIEDPYESPAPREPRGPRSGAGAALRLCWFGNIGASNFDMVAEAFKAIARGMQDRGLHIDIVTRADRRAAFSTLAGELARLHSSLTLEFIEWSPALTWAAIERCDVVVLPQDHVGSWGRVKSHNRLVEAIRGGRIAVASPIPSYEELQDFAWVGADLAAGVRWALANADEAVRRVAAGQHAVEQRFAPRVIGEKWAQALGLPSPTPGTVGGAARRLNLGCGDKILDGYINVDVAPSRAGKAPDVLCDLHALEPFETHSCDEVMAIHVVEHFWRWEVVDTLREWLRVLKPGGQMILECPNLLTACEELLNNPQAGVGPGPEGQRTMWVLYGDPGWRDPLMCHRWNYTPDSLRAVMEEAGLVNVRQAPAQFKLREPRDMRLVGEKPQL